MRILFDNLLLSATLAAGSPSPNYPVDNLKDPILKKRYQSTAASDTVTMTWPADKVVDSCYLGHTNAVGAVLELFNSGGVSLYRKRFSAAAGGIRFAQVSGVRSATLTIYAGLLGVSAVYLGSIGVGAAYAMPDPNAEWDPTAVDNSVRSETLDGQLGILKVQRLRRLAAPFRVLSWELFASIESLVNDLDRPVFADPFENSHGTTVAMGDWDGSSLPEIPNDPAGVTWKRTTDWALADWAPNDAGTTEALDGGYYKASKVTSSGTIDTGKSSVSAWSNKTMRLKIFSSVAGAIRIGHNPGGTFAALKEVTAIAGDNLIDVTLGASITTVWVQALTRSVGDYIILKDAYVGTGAYLSNSVPDLSGIAAHGTAYGVTPIDTAYGRALNFDNLNDYILLDVTKVAWTGPFTMILRVQGKARSTTQFCFTRDSNAGGGFGIRLGMSGSSNGKPYMAITGDGTNLVALTGAAGTEVTSDSIIAYVFNPSTVMRILKNGIDAVTPLTTGVPAQAFYSASQIAQFGALGAARSNPLDGWLGSRMIMLDYVPDDAELKRLCDPNGPEFFDASHRMLPMYAGLSSLQNIKKDKECSRFTFSLDIKEAR